MMKAIIRINDDSNPDIIAEKIMQDLSNAGFGGMFNLDVLKGKKTKIQFLIPGHYDEFAREIESVIENVMDTYSLEGGFGISGTYSVQSMSVFDERIKSNVNHVVRGINLLDADLRRRGANGERIQGESYESHFADGYLIKDILVEEKYVCFTITMMAIRGSSRDKPAMFYITNHSNKVYDEKEWLKYLKENKKGGGLS